VVLTDDGDAAIFPAPGTGATMSVLISASHAACLCSAVSAGPEPSGAMRHERERQSAHALRDATEIGGVSMMAERLQRNAESCLVRCSDLFPLFWFGLNGAAPS